MEGQRIGSYRVGRKIGQGGMGAVYEAVHEQIGRKAAIKLLRKELSQDPQIANRFLNEARAASRVEHSGIVQIFEFGHLPDGTAYIIMELLRGEPLSARLRSLGGKLQLPDTIRVGRQIASALAATHAKGIVHRDLKPDNIMLVPDDDMPGGERVKILDFGVAKVVTQYSGPANPDAMTNTGMVLGTASYMAPEQCKGAGSVTDRADVYSLGIVMYRMLVGHLPFRAEGQGEVMAMHIFSRARALREIDPNIPEPMAALVERMMEKEPTERPSMVLVAGELERLTGRLTPGGQPVMVLVGPSLTSGQHPTAPTLSVVGAPSQPSSATGAGEPAPKKTTPTPSGQPQKPRSHGLLYTLLVLMVLGGGGAAAWRTGALKPLLALINPPAPPPAPPAPPELVYWTLTSIPSDAQVIRKNDNTVLDHTPWNHAQPKGTGKQVVILRKAGFRDMEVELDERSSMTPTVALLPLSADMGRADLAPAAAPAPVPEANPGPSPTPVNPTPEAATPPSAGPAANPAAAKPPKPKKPRSSQDNSSGALTDDQVGIFKD